MKRSILVATVLVFLFQAASPSPASAHIGWWDWLEELSGPGPFHRKMLVADWRVRCQVERRDGASVERQWTSDRLLGRQRAIVPPNSQRMNAIQRYAIEALPCSTLQAYGPPAEYRVRAFVEVRYGKTSTGEKPVFSDQPLPRGVVTAHAFQANYLRQFRGVSIGAGGGVVFFTGKEVLTHRPVRFVLTPLSATVRPFEFFLKRPKKLGDLIIARYELVAVLGGFRASDFVEPTLSQFKSGTELLRSGSISLNLAALLR